jgi:hypothetical protein
MTLAPLPSRPASVARFMYHICTRGPLETNVHVHISGAAFPFMVIRMYTCVVVSMNALLLLAVAIINA